MKTPFDKLQHEAESNSRGTAAKQLGFGSFCLQSVCKFNGTLKRAWMGNPNLALPFFHMRSQAPSRFCGVFALFFPTAYVVLRKYDLKHRGSDGLGLRTEKCHVTPPRADAGR